MRRAAITALLLAACGDEPVAVSARTIVLPPAPAPQVDPVARFEAAFRHARPSTTEGWLPEVGERVLARFVDTSWYAATVVAVYPPKRKVRLRWNAGAGGERDLPLAEVAPLKPGVDRAGLALARPLDDGRWLEVEVAAIDGDQAEVIDRHGQRRTLPRADLVAMTR